MACETLTQQLHDSLDCKDCCTNTNEFTYLKGQFRLSLNHIYSVPAAECEKMFDSMSAEAVCGAGDDGGHLCML